MLIRCSGCGQPFGHHDGGIVARLHDDALDQFFGGGAVALGQEHCRAALGHRLGRNPERGVEGDGRVLLQRLEQHVERHQLRHAGRRQRDVGVLLQQDRVRGHIEHPGRLGPGFERGRGDLSLAKDEGKAQSENAGHGHGGGPQLLTK